MPLQKGKLISEQNVLQLNSIRDTNLIVPLTSRLYVWQRGCFIITLPSMPGSEFEAGINFVGVGSLRQFSSVHVL